MTRSGEQYMASLHDGRCVILDGERIGDVMTHPAFSEAVRSVARLFDIANNPANRQIMTLRARDAATNRKPFVANSKKAA